MKFVFIYITTKDYQEAKKIGKHLVEKRFAACINIIDNVGSMYWWENKIQDEKETILIVKTKQSMVEKIIKEVKLLHSDSCPCIIALPIENGNKDYLEWIEGSTK